MRCLYLYGERGSDALLTTALEITMTNLEIKFMNIIARCEMNQINGAVPESAHDVNTYTWADERAADMGISEKALGGVIASLIQKDFIACTTGEGDDNGTCFLDAGFEAWNAHPAADKA